MKSKKINFDQPIRVIFMGTPVFAVPTLKKLLACDYCKLVAVITQPDKKSGRVQKLVFSPVKKLALKHNVLVLQPKNIKNSKIKRTIDALRPDIIIVAAYGQILPQTILEIPRFGCLNIHASLLPKFRGPSPIQYTILENEKETGVTIMLMDEQMDHGDIVAQKKIKVYNKDTAISLCDRLSKVGAEVVMEVLPKWVLRKIKPVPQDHSKATYTKILKKEDGKIDWKDNVEKIERKIRAFYPWPGTYTNFRCLTHNYPKLKRLKIIQAEVYTVDRRLKPGTVFQTPDKKLAVACGRGSLVLKKVQVEGKREISGEEFLRGYDVKSLQDC